MSESLAILVPVWKNYQWIAPLTARLLDRFWPGHPPVWYVGLDQASSTELNILPLAADLDRSNWTKVLLAGVQQLREKGVELCYLINEEHVPLAPCAKIHLEKTLPDLMRDAPAVYISLMGWDNRRYPSRSPVIPEFHHCKHLVGAGDPRFHLHPALWRTEVLEACCQLALRDPSKNGSAWHFEKVNDRAGSELPEAWNRRCYQISAAALSARPRGPVARLVSAAERWIYHKLMAVYPLIPHPGAANRYARAVGFDNFFCDGPYPMFYSGIMVKGGLNPYFLKFLGKTTEGRELLREILAAQPHS